jgi:CHAT domain-containing protein
LGADLNRALGLNSATSGRKPRLRSSIEDEDPPPGTVKLEDIVRQSSQLLLPQNFDTSFKHLVIIPALNIGSIPFHLLQPYADKSLLIEKCSFTIAPGLLDLALMRWKWLKQNGIEVVNLFRKAGKDADEAYFGEKMMKRLNAESRFTVENPLFISNPLYPTHTKYIFPDLPGAKKEVRFATRYLEKYKILDSAAAIKDSVIRLMDGADVAYFATHGVSSAEQPMENSFLVLSGADPFLTAKDIMSLRNRKVLKQFPELVVLSACQTGLGRPIEAGIAGLARAFLLGGSNNVIMSLWSVDDEATAYLMSRFFYNLQNTIGDLPAAPLRKAILETRKKFPHPSQWASFSVFGIDY